MRSEQGIEEPELVHTSSRQVHVRGRECHPLVSIDERVRLAEVEEETDEGNNVASREITLSTLDGQRQVSQGTPGCHAS